MINAPSKNALQAWKNVWNLHITESIIYQIDLGKLMQECNAKLIEMDETKRTSVSSKKVLAEQTRNFNRMTPEETLTAVQDLLKLYQVEIESLSKRCKQAENSFSNVVTTLTPLPDPASFMNMLRNESEQDATTVADLKKTIKALESEMTTLKNQDVTVRKLEKRLHETQMEQKSEIESRESVWSQKVEQSRVEAETRSQALQEQVSKWKRDYESVVEESKSAQKNIVIEQKRHEEILSSKNTELETLRRQIGQLKEEQVHLQATVSSSSASNNINLYKDIISQSEDRISKLQVEVEKARESEIRSKTAEERARKEMESNTIAFSSEITGFKKSIDGMLSDVRSLHPLETVTSIEDVSGVIRKLRDLRQAEAEKEKSTAFELKNLRDRNSELESAIVKANNELESYRDSFTEIPKGQEIELAVSGDASNVVAIITSQRDRLRTRAIELETERDTLKQGQLDLANKINVLMADMRRLEQERNFWRTSSQNKSGSNSDVETGGSGRPSGAVTPPVLFSKLRKAATGNGDFEQAATSIIVYGIGNPIIRRVALGYLLTLHLLVFMVLYRLSSIVSTDSNSQ